MNRMDILFLCMLIGCGALFFVPRYLRTARAASRIKYVKQGGGKAASYLIKQGYKIVDVQRRIPIKTIVNGKSYQNMVQADLIVKKNGKIYVVKLKNYETNTKIISQSVRRKLLECYLVYRPDGILFVDVERERLRTVEFSVPGGERKGYLALLFFCGMVLGSGLFYLWSKGGTQ